jgi:hypothetical protein
MWAIWIARNYFIINHQQWNHMYVTNLILQGLMDYALVEWVKTQKVIRKHPERTKKILARFDIEWGNFPTICKHSDLIVSWAPEVPDMGIT